MKTKTIHLGSLGLMAYFKLEGDKTVYRTITYPPYNASPTCGNRWVLNMKTLKARWFFCREKVIKTVKPEKDNDAS